MKQLILAFALLPVLAFGQNQAPTRTYSINDGAFYAKNKTNFQGNQRIEAGFSAPMLSNGNTSVSWNVGYLMNVNNPWNDNGWQGGLSVGYRLSKTWSAYTKTSTDFGGTWSQETGLRKSLFRTSNYAVNANAGYVFDYPFRNSSSPKWTAGVTVSFPVNTLFK